MPNNPYDFLEPEKPPYPQAPIPLPRLERFEHLEIGHLGELAAASASIPKAEHVLCPLCGQANEAERELCWACFKPLRPQGASEAPPTDVTLILDGTTYKSSDPGLPDDIQDLFRRIQKEGYSESLMADWRKSREAAAKAGSEEKDGAFQGPRRSVIRLDGKLYYSDDPELTPQLKELFAYLAANGVTPELMERLRQSGDKVKFRPRTTASPSDGDLAFWRQVSGASPAEPLPGLVARLPAFLVMLVFIWAPAGIIYGISTYDGAAKIQTALAEGAVIEVLDADRPDANFDIKKVKVQFKTDSGREIKSSYLWLKNAAMDSKVQVRYDPERPENHSLVLPENRSRQISPILFAMILMAAFLSLPVLGWYLTGTWSRRRQALRT